MLAMAALWAYVTAKVRVRVRRVRVRVRTPNPNPYPYPYPNPNPNPSQLVGVISSSDPDTTIFRNQVPGGRGRLRAGTRCVAVGVGSGLGQGAWR